MACYQALRLVEIVGSILLYLPSRGDLASCARLNQLWHGEAIPRLWREVHDWRAFLKLRDVDVFSKYSRHVRKVVIKRMSEREEDDIRELVESNVLAKTPVVELHLDESHGLMIKSIPDFLQKALRVLTINFGKRGLQMPQNLFAEIQGKAPLLEVLRVTGHHIFTTAAKLFSMEVAAFLENMPSLRYADGLHSAYDDETLIKHLAHRSDLERVSFHGAPLFSCLDSLFQGSGILFPALRSLSLSMATSRWSDFQRLLARLSRLKALTIICDGDLEMLYGGLSFCPNLTQLKCASDDCQPGQRPFAPGALERLVTCCSELRWLEIQNVPWHYAQQFELSRLAGRFEDLAQHLRHVEVLHLPVLVTAEEIFTPVVAQLMPHLYRCRFAGMRFSTLLGDEDLFKSRAESVVFPQLSEICIDDYDLFTTSSTGLSNRKSIINMLCRMLPVARDFSGIEADDIQRAAMIQLRTRLGERPEPEPRLDFDKQLVRKIYLESLDPAAKRDVLQHDEA